LRLNERFQNEFGKFSARKVFKLQTRLFICQFKKGAWIVNSNYETFNWAGLFHPLEFAISRLSNFN